VIVKAPWLFHFNSHRGNLMAFLFLRGQAE
jgi:hypothetical protein